MIISALVAGFVPLAASASQAANPTQITSGDFVYTLDGSGNATIVDNAPTIQALLMDPIVIPETIDGHPVVEIGIYAFQNCGAHAVVFPRSLLRIRVDAFDACYLSSVTFPPHLETLEAGAFQENRITKIFFTGPPPANMSDTVFKNQVTITHAQVSVLKQYTDVTNPWHGFDVNWVDPYATEPAPGNAAQLTITEFYGDAPSSLVIPSALSGKPVTSISANVFKGIPLGSVTIPEGVTSIGDNAFMGTGLTSVTLPSTLLSIGGSAFSGSGAVSNNLSSVDIPSSVTTIGDYAFGLNPTLNTVNLLGNAPSTLGVSLFFFSGQRANVRANVYTGATGYVDEKFDAYPITRIARPVLSSDATLSALVTDPVSTLSPTFPALSLRYAASVANSVTSITVKPTAAESHATITVNGLAVLSGSASQPITLTVGTNPINIITTAQDGSTTFTYVLTVTRLAANLSSISTLKSVEFPAVGTYGPNVTPTFAATTTSYSATVPFSIKTFKIKPTVTDTGKATVAVNGTQLRAGGTSEVTLSPGDNAISVVVTAEDQSTKTYTVNVHQNIVSTDATLSNLQVTGGAMMETFSPSLTSYTVNNIPSSTTDFYFKPYLNFDLATVKVDGQVTSNKRSNPTAISIPVGTSKVVNVVVTAEDGTTTKTYSITVNRVVAVAKPTIKTAGGLTTTSSSTVVGATFGFIAPVFNGTVTTRTVRWWRCAKQYTTASTTQPSAIYCDPLNVSSNTYKLTKLDKGQYVLVAVTATNSGGSVTWYSATTRKIN